MAICPDCLPTPVCNGRRLQYNYTVRLMQGIVFEPVYKDLTLFFFAGLFGIEAFIR